MNVSIALAGSRSVALLLLLLSGQDSGIPELIRRLGSVDPAERTAAYDQLRDQGEGARPWLEKAVRDPDSEVSSRAGTLLRRINLQKELPRGTPIPTPEALDHLSRGEDPEWVSIYLNVSKLEPRSSDIRRWLERYSSLAFRSATTAEEKKSLCDALDGADRNALGEVLKLLRDEGDGVRDRAAQILGNHSAYEKEEELTALLRDPLPATRIAAAQALENIFAQDAQPLLEPLIADPSPEVRRAVLSSIYGSYLWGSRAGDIRARTVKRFSPLLKDPDEDIRALAASRLGEGGDREGVLPLLSALKDPEPHVRALSCEALGTLGAAEAAPGLLDCLRKDTSPQVRRSAAAALGQVAAPGATAELLRDALDLKEDVTVRGAALGALAAIKAPEALEAGRSLLGDEQSAIWMSAVQVVLALGDRPSAGVLATMLKDKTESKADSVFSLLVQSSAAWMADSLLPLVEDPSWMVRKRAILVLRALKSEKAMPALVRRLGDEHGEVRAAALLGRDWIRTREAGAELRRLLHHAVPEIRQRAVENVLALLGAGGAEDLVPLVDELDPKVRASAIEALASLERPQDLPRFLHRLTDFDPSVRAHAASAIAQQQGWEMLPEIRILASTGPEEARPDAVKLLLEMGVRENIPEIMSLLASPNSPVQWQALEALDPLDPKERADALQALLGNADAPVRPESLPALAALGAREALPRIRPLLKHPDPAVRAAALEALADLGDRESIPAVLKMFEEGDRTPACGFLATVGAREAVPVLEEALENESGCYYDALQALGRLGARGSARKVFAHFGQKACWGESFTGQTLGVLGAREFIPDLRKYLRHRYRRLRSQAAVALGELHATEAVADLLPMLKDPDNGVVTEAAEALGRIGAREAIPGIRAALHERPWDWEMSWWITCGVGAGPRRGLLLEALVRLNAREALPDLLEILRTESARDIAATIRLFRDPTSRPALVDFLSNHSEPFSDPNTWPEEWTHVPRVLLSKDLDFLQFAPYSTAELLGELGAKEFTPDLVRLLNTGPRKFRLPAANALCLLGSDQGVRLILEQSQHGDPGGLLSLNALRSRGLWARMAETRFPKTACLSKKGLWQEIARAAGVGLELPPEAYSRPSADSCERSDVRVYEDLFSLLDVARELQARTSYQMILEEDRIRMVRLKEAVQFWKQWAGR